MSDAFKDRIYNRQKAHIKDLSEKLDIIRNEMWSILDILNTMHRPPGVKLNPISNKIIDIINLLKPPTTWPPSPTTHQTPTDTESA